MAFVHHKWERNGRTLIDDQNPLRRQYTTRVGETNIDMGEGAFAPYVSDGASLQHGDAECNFADGFQQIKRLGQILVSQSRLYVQRLVSGSWTDVPHGLPTRNIAHNYPSDGKCTAYLDFSNIQGYAAGARFQVGIEVGGGDRQTYGFRFRSPVAGTFRLEWVLEIPEDVDLAWITAPTSKTDPTPIKLGGRIGQTEIRWSREEAPFRSVTVDSGASGRIVRVLLGPYTVAPMEWLTIYPDTWGPNSIGDTADDCQETGGGVVSLTGLDSDGLVVGNISASNTRAAFRFPAVDIPASPASVDTGTRIQYCCTYSQGSITAHITYGLEGNCPQWSSEVKPSQQTRTDAYVSQAPPSIGVDREVSGVNFQALIKEILDTGWTSGNALGIEMIVSAAESAGFQIEDFSTIGGGTYAARLTIVYTASAGTTINLTGNISGASVTGDLSAIVARALLANAAAFSLTPDMAAVSARSLLAAISGASNAPDLSAIIAGSVSLAAAIAGNSMTGDLSAAIARSLAGAIAGQAQAPDIAAALARNLAAGIVGIGAAPDLSANTQRLLAAGIGGQSVTPSLPAAVIRSLSASIQAGSDSPDLAAGIVRALIAAISGQSQAPDVAISIQGIVTLAASISGASSTPDMQAGTARSLAAGIAGQSETPDISAAVLRALLASIAGSAVVPDLELSLSSMVQLAAAVQGVSFSPDLSAGLARSLAADIAAQAEAPDISPTAERLLVANIQGISFAPNGLTVLMGIVSPIKVFQALPALWVFRALPSIFTFQSRS